MRKVHNVSDEELIDLIHQGNVRASEIFFNRYYHYSWRIAFDFDREHPNSGIALEDYHSIAFATTVISLKKFLNDHDIFYGYWKSCAKNEIMEYFLENSYTAKGHVYTGISLDFETESSILSEEVGAIDFTLTTEILKKEFDMIKEDVLESFKKKKDTKIINLFLEDKSFDEIQSITGDNLRHIYYVIKKFQKLFGQEIKKRNYQ